MNKEEKVMKFTKKRIFVSALTVCLLASLSFGTLAWFSASDEVTNNFMVAGSEDGDPDKIFSVDVWEDDDLEDPEDDQKFDELNYYSILPGDSLYKEVHIENTGSYDQYIRATVTVSGARVWQEVYGEYVMPLAAIVGNFTENPIYDVLSYYDAENDTFVYEFYFDKAIAADEEIILFETVEISSELTREQAAELYGAFHIDVVADAVQVANVGDNVYEAFKTVGEVKTVKVADEDALKEALLDETVTRVVVDADDMAVVINYSVENKVLDFNGLNGSVKFTKESDTTNVTVCGIRDTDGAQSSVWTSDRFAGELKVVDCVMLSNENAAMELGSGNITVSGCTLLGVEGAAAPKGINNSSKYKGNLVVNDCSFNNLKNGISINIMNGDLSLNYCAFENVITVLYNPGKNYNNGNITWTDCTRDGNLYPAN